MNIIEKWFFFNEPERFYHKLSSKFSYMIEDINLLDKKRQDLQKKIVELSNASDVCFNCKGVCCRGDYNHFTGVDYLVRLHSDRPINSFGIISMPPTLKSLVFTKLNQILTRTSGTEELKKITTKCPDLGDGTCKFLPEDRPIRCVLWTCTEFKKEFNQKTLREIGYLNKELEKVVKEVIKIYNGKKLTAIFNT